MYIGFRTVGSRNKQNKAREVLGGLKAISDGESGRWVHVARDRGKPGARGKSPGVQLSPFSLIALGQINASFF